MLKQPGHVLFLIFLLCVTTGLKLFAQTATGSVGEPVFTETFGSGTANPGPQLPAGETSYPFSGDICPNDGFYSIVNSTSNCYLNVWHTVHNDHTGNPNGYMMLVNASYNTGPFFTEKIFGLCPNTKYELSAWILNLTRPTACSGASKQPNITFLIESHGQLLQTYNTKDIPPVAADTVWKQYATYFTTPVSTTDVEIKMINNATGGCGNDIALDDITFKPWGPEIVSTFSNSNSLTLPLCEGDATETSMSVSVPSAVNPQYQWQVYHANTGWADTLGQQSGTFKIQLGNTSPGTYQYRAGINNGSDISVSGCRVYSQPFTINITPKPVIQGLSSRQTVCEGDPILLSATGGVTYQWEGPDINPSTKNTLLIDKTTMANAGLYKVTAYGQYGCATTITANLIVFPKVNATVTGNTTICHDDKTILTAAGGISYLWSPGKTLSDSTIANPIASPVDTTTYSVTVTDANGCFNTKTVTVNVQRKPIANAGSDKTIFEGQTAYLSPEKTYGDKFYWTPTTALSDPDILAPTANPSGDITYTLHAVTTCGEDSSKVSVKVFKTITIPNTFSPNSDGVNDLWDIKELATYPNCILSVFDRYGKQLFRSIGYGKPWDGRCNGQLLSTGTYYYVLNLKNSTPPLTGWVLLVR